MPRDLPTVLREYAASARLGTINAPRGVCEQAADEIEQLRGALRECADDLASELEGRYAGLKDHPAMLTRYERDMVPVFVARKLLGDEQSR